MRLASLLLILALSSALHGAEWHEDPTRVVLMITDGKRSEFIVARQLLGTSSDRRTLWILDEQGETRRIAVRDKLVLVGVCHKDDIALMIKRMTVRLI